MRFSELTRPELESIIENANFTEDELVVFKMLTKGKTITEIAQKCGFSSIHVFSKLFRSICQMTPSAYAALPENQAGHTMLKYADYDLEKSIFYNE